MGLALVRSDGLSADEGLECTQEAAALTGPLPFTWMGPHVPALGQLCSVRRSGGVTPSTRWWADSLRWKVPPRAGPLRWGDGV